MAVLTIKGSLQQAMQALPVIGLCVLAFWCCPHLWVLMMIGGGLSVQTFTLQDPDAACQVVGCGVLTNRAGISALLFSLQFNILIVSMPSAVPTSAAIRSSSA